MVPTITVAICTYNRFDYLPRALESLERQTVPQSEFEVLIVDNSDDMEAANRFWESYVLRDGWRLVRSSPPGLSRARNTAVEEARAETILYLDDDAVASAGLVEEYAKYFAAHPDVGVAGGPIAPIWPDVAPDWVPDDFVGCLSVLDYGDTDKYLEGGQYLYGANIAFRKAALEAAGGFDTNIGRIGAASLLSNEEVVVQEHVHRAGFKRAYVANAAVRHQVPQGRLRRNWFRSRMAWQAVSEVLSGEAGGYHRDYSAQMLSNLAKSMDMEPFVYKLLNASTKEEFSQQLHFMRHLIAVLLDAQHADERALEGLAKKGAVPTSKQSRDKYSDAEVTAAALPPLGSDKPHLFAEYNPGHSYLYDAYALSGQTHFLPMQDNPWEVWAGFSLLELEKGITADNRTLTFLTIEPFLQPAQVTGFRLFVEKQPVVVNAFLHRLPSDDAVLQNLRAVARSLGNLFVLSESFRQLAVRETGIENIRVVPHHPTKFHYSGVSRSTARDNLGIRPSQIVVSLVGELRRNKGVETLLAALPMLGADAKKRLVFLLAGKATHYDPEALSSAFSDAGCEHRVLCGGANTKGYAYLNARKFTECLAASDLGLLLYEDVQAKLTSGILSDYVWRGTPVVTTEGSVTGRDVCENKLGFVVAERDPSQLAELLNRFVSSDQGFEKAPQFEAFRQSVAPENVAQNLLELLNEPS